jgi:hypothetical protein
MNNAARIGENRQTAPDCTGESYQQLPLSRKRSPLVNLSHKLLWYPLPTVASRSGNQQRISTDSGDLFTPKASDRKCDTGSLHSRAQA